MNISVIGTGYVGLVAGACFADNGNRVFCVDQNEEKIEALKRGEIPIYEPGLESIVRRAVEQERLFFTTSTKDAVRESEIIFMAVGTPPTDTGEPDMSFIQQAAYSVAEGMSGYRLIVNKSTVPVGAHRQVAEWIGQKTDLPFDVVSNPEFLKEGSAVDDFLKPDRVIIGTDKDSAFEKMQKLYAPFCRQGNPILKMDPVTAELTKYACNSFLATRISFMNELSQLCERVGANVEDIRKGMTTDARIGKHFLYAGVGYGGSCFPKDVQALLATGKKNDVPLSIIDSVERANAKQKLHLVKKVQNRFGSDLSKRSFAIWGIAFKPNTDDIREAPALVIATELLKRGATLKVFDPVAMENAKEELGDQVEYCHSIYESAQGADAILLVTEWREFRHPDWKQILSSVKTPVMFDGRNVYDPRQMKDLGIEYFGIGRA